MEPQPKSTIAPKESLAKREDPKILFGKLKQIGNRDTEAFREAFDAFHERFYPILFRSTKRSFEHVSFEIITEAIQNTFIFLFKNLERIDVAGFSQYLTMKARKQVLEIIKTDAKRLKRIKPRDPSGQDEEEYGSGAVLPPVVDADEPHHTEVTASDIFEFLETQKNINSRHKEIFYDKFGLSGENPRLLEEVAAKYGVSAERVSQIVRPIVEILKEHFGSRNGLYFIERMKE